MARLRTRVARAVALHQQAAATASVAARLLRGYTPANAAADHHAEQRALAANLRAAAARLAPGWLDAPLDALSATTPLGGSTLPAFVRVGQAHPLDDASFPVMVPLLRAGHVAIDADARDPRVAGLLRTLVLRLLAAAPLGSVQIRIVDSAEVGATFEAFNPTVAPAVTDQAGLRALLTEAERWVASRVADQAAPALLLVIASLPELTDGSDLARIFALAKAGPAGRLHIIAAGWPPPPLTAETTQRPLPYCTQIVLRNPHAWVGDPPGTSFGAGGIGPSRLNAPVYLDPDPPPDLIRRVCAELTDQTAGWRPDTPPTPGTPPTPEASPPPGTPGTPPAQGTTSVSGAPPASGPAPAHSAWREYIATAQRLDTVRRGANSIVAEHGKLRSVAVEELAGVHTRLTRQAARLTDVAAMAGLPAPPLAPDPQLVEAEWEALTRGTGALPGALVAMPIRPGGIPAPPVGAPTGSHAAARVGSHAVLAAVRSAGAKLGAADAALADVEPGTAAPGSPVAVARPLWRNIAVYGVFAALAAIAQVPLILLVDDLRAVAPLAVGAAFALPTLGFGLAWALLGTMDTGRATQRTPLVGAVLSMACATPLLTLSGYLLISSLFRH